MIKIHKMDGYKYMRDPDYPMVGFKRRNMTYICLEMTDWIADIKMFNFLEEHHSFHYDYIMNELVKHVKTTTIGEGDSKYILGKLPKIHIVLKEESRPDGSLERTVSISKKEPYGILEYINMEKERYIRADENRENEWRESARLQAERDAKNQAKKNKKALNGAKEQNRKKVTKEVLNDYLNNTDYYDFVKKNKDNIRYKDGVLYINSESLAKEFSTFNKDFNDVQEAKLVPIFMSANEYFNDYFFKYYEAVRWVKDENIGYVHLHEIRKEDTPSNLKLGLIYEWLETYIDSDF